MSTPRLVDDEEHTRQAAHEAIHVYDISLTSIEGEAMIGADGRRFISELPAIWLASIDPFAILERAILAEDEDPRPICAAMINYGFPNGAGALAHCIRDQHHIGEHASSLE